MTNQKRKKWLHTPFENKDLPNIGSFFKNYTLDLMDMEVWDIFIGKLLQII